MEGYRLWLMSCDDDEIENELYTLRNESRWLDLSEDEVARRIAVCEVVLAANRYERGLR